jgi:hypothetical protein
LFDLEVAGAARFLLGLDGVDVAGLGGERQIDAVLARVLEQLLDQRVGVICALTVDHSGQRVHPFSGFLVVGAGGAVDGFLFGWFGHARVSFK